MTPVRALLRAAEQQLHNAGIPSAHVDATELLAAAWHRKANDVRHAAVVGEAPDATTVQRFEALVQERSRRVPLQHLTGIGYFRHLEIAVGPGVFVPRPETELLVDLLLPVISAADTVVDLCSGSGAIAFALRQESSARRVIGVEVSQHAMAWASQNRDRLGLDVEFVTADATTALPELDGAVDVIASNPPYIPVGAVPVDPEVRDHDPQLALYGGSADGLKIPLAVAQRASELLRDGGVLAMEHADTQGDSMTAGLHTQGVWDSIQVHHDLTGRPRVTTATRRARVAGSCDNGQASSARSPQGVAQ